MSSSAPVLFDRQAVLRNRKRAREDALFLHRTAIREAEDRLNMVKRAFTDAAIVTPFPELWQDAWPNAASVADNDALDLEPNRFDLVIHAMCLHWANDPVGQLIQCRRALRPDGLFLAILLGGQTLCELRRALGAAEAQVSQGLSPRVAPMAEIRDLGGLLQRAGFALPVADIVPLAAEYRDLRHLMRDLRHMGEGNALNGRIRRATGREIFKSAEEHYQRNDSLPSGRLSATFELACLTGWAPDPSQPQALRPGSATHRLADALGTTESGLGD